MPSPDIKGMSRTAAPVPESYRLPTPPVSERAPSRSPVFSRATAPAGNYAVVLFLVGVSVVFVTFVEGRLGMLCSCSFSLHLLLLDC